MNILITICARGGSKELPNKHLKRFNGKKLIGWTIEAARRFQIMNRFKYNTDIILSSDSENILYEARYPIYGHYRNDGLAKDKTPKLDAIRDALEVGEHVFLKEYSTVIDLDATNPCRKVNHINKSLEIFKKKLPEVLFSVTKARKSPYFNQIDKYGQIMGYYPKRISAELLFYCRQDAPECFDMNSSIYIAHADWIRDDKNKSWTSANLIELYKMPEWTAFDIDSEVDFEIAEFLHNRYFSLIDD